MPTHSFRVVNAFADSPLSGNPLAVFEDAREMDDATMQALALQFNLSETTFILPSRVATKQVRIFTPAGELPFAGHPTLGTAHVVRSLLGTGDRVSLQMLKRSSTSRPPATSGRFMLTRRGLVRRRHRTRNSPR